MRAASAAAGSSSGVPAAPSRSWTAARIAGGAPSQKPSPPSSRARETKSSPAGVATWACANSGAPASDTDVGADRRQPVSRRRADQRREREVGPRRRGEVVHDREARQPGRDRLALAGVDDDPDVVGADEDPHVGEHVPLRGQQRRQRPAAGRRAGDVAGHDAVQETAAVGARRDDELAAGVGAQHGLAGEGADVAGAGHRFFIARASRRRTARRARASAFRRRSSAVSSASAGTGRGWPSSSTATNVRNARVV